MTNAEIFQIALLQSAYDCSCSPQDFLKERNVVVLSKRNEKARVYVPLPAECDMVSYGNNIVAQTSERLNNVVQNYLDSYSPSHCFETPNMRVLDDELQKFGLKICFQSEFFLPDVNKLKQLKCDYRIEVLLPKDFKNLYADGWNNALCEKRRDLDMLAVGAYDGNKLIGLAGASADCETMWQLGVDVLCQYRRQGVASALVSRLSLETLALGKVPFYCAAWCNIKSVRNALKCGYYPAWTQLTARDAQFVDKFNADTRVSR